MDKAALIEKIKAMGASPSCCPELKLAVEDYLRDLGTTEEKFTAEKLIEEIQADVVLTDQLIIFAHSNNAIKMFGAENAKKFAANADELKRRGIKYCNCLACTIGIEVLKHKDLLLA